MRRTIILSILTLRFYRDFLFFCIILIIHFINSCLNEFANTWQLFFINFLHLIQTIFLHKWFFVNILNNTIHRFLSTTWCIIDDWADRRRVTATTGYAAGWLHPHTIHSLSFRIHPIWCFHLWIYSFIQNFFKILICSDKSTIDELFIR